MVMYTILLSAGGCSQHVLLLGFPCRGFPSRAPLLMTVPFLASMKPHPTHDVFGVACRSDAVCVCVCFV